MIEGNPIMHKNTLKGEAERIQLLAMERAYKNRELCLKAYCERKESHNGVYINSDLFKELFRDLKSFNVTNNEFDLAVHNSSAWLAQQLFEEKIKDSNLECCIFLTGVPGAGKTIFVQSLFEEGKVPDNYIIFEGSVCNVEKTAEKMQMLKDKGIDINIIVISANIDIILDNVRRREADCGRGATVVSIAQIASRIKSSIAQLNSMFNISALGLFQKNRGNEDVMYYEGVEAIQNLPDYNYDQVLSYIQKALAQNEGMVL